MATNFITFSQVHRPKTSISTRKPPRSNRNKPRASTSIGENMLNNILSGKTLTENCNNLNSHPLTDSLLFMEDQSEKGLDTSREEHGKMLNCNRKDDKSISVTKYGDLSHEVARLSLVWYMKCSISYILRRARAFYNEFCCDTNLENSTIVEVDPYFSIPVLPFSN